MRFPSRTDFRGLCLSQIATHGRGVERKHSWSAQSGAYENAVVCRPGPVELRGTGLDWRTNRRYVGERMTWRKIILRTLEKHEWSGYRLGKESGVPIRTIQKFLSGSDITMSRLERICSALNLKLRPARRRREK